MREEELFGAELWKRGGVRIHGVLRAAEGKGVGRRTTQDYDLF